MTWRGLSLDIYPQRQILELSVRFAVPVEFASAVGFASVVDFALTSLH
jgi:hypothetical protein